RELMLIQQDISEKINSQFLNKRLKVIIDKKVEGEPEQYLGRTEYDAPDVDGQVYIKSGNPRIKPGTIIKVLVKDTYEYDLVADHVR
ncbi:MAG: 30S ribosomal protein S12 methylthiotransferase RimO, partial [Candidatus Omnitrophica bacterium]|nr:30S ribosomal protein S12 methylthiotransferase RimO [Candidatus Omnitrophota bacterium]